MSYSSGNHYNYIKIIITRIIILKLILIMNAMNIANEKNLADELNEKIYGIINYYNKSI